MKFTIGLVVGALLMALAFEAGILWQKQRIREYVRAIAAEEFQINPCSDPITYLTSVIQ